jgi:hypothetical protein
MAAVAARAGITRRAVGAWNPDVLIAKLSEVDMGDPSRVGEDRAELDKLIRRS